MGLKKTNYTIKDYDITVDSAYAQITSLNVDLEGNAHVVFEVQQTRENIGKNKQFETKVFDCTIDKDKPIHKQIYDKAKEEIFKDWEDDIVK